MTELQAVLFDLDGTLIGFNDDAYNSMIAGVCADLGSGYGLDKDALFRLHSEKSIAHWRNPVAGVFRASTGATDGESIMIEIWQEALSALGCTDPAAARSGFDGYWAGRGCIYSLFGETLEVLDALQGSVPLAMITNGPADTQLDKLESTGLRRYFDVVVSSGDAGVAKPDPGIFRLALDKLGAEARRSWHIGDSLHADVGGALAVGARGAWVNRRGEQREPHHPIPHAEATTLRELLPFLLR